MKHKRRVQEAHAFSRFAARRDRHERDMREHKRWRKLNDEERSKRLAAREPNERGCYEPFAS